MSIVNNNNNINKYDPKSIGYNARLLNLFIETPLIKSNRISELIGRTVYFKMDVLQKSGSFKDRGIGYLCYTIQQLKGVQKLISSSGGNAGLAAACIGNQLGMSVHVIVPQTTKQLVIDKLQSFNATVTVYGSNWNEADVLAREYVAQDNKSAYISPYDNELLWTGHSTVIDEIYQQLESIHNEQHEHPSCIIASVGGGGLLCGIYEGIDRQLAKKQQQQSSSTSQYAPHVIAAETIGAASFGTSYQSKQLIRLDAINTIATSLGALQVTSAALERSLSYPNSHIALCTDSDAVDACVQFLKDHNILVEPACGAALAVVYNEKIRNDVLGPILTKHPGPIVVEVCGGSGISLELLDQWKEQFNIL